MSRGPAVRNFPGSSTSAERGPVRVVVDDQVDRVRVAVAAAAVDEIDVPLVSEVGADVNVQTTLIGSGP